jgi:hypothetical protein
MYKFRAKVSIFLKKMKIIFVLKKKHLTLRRNSKKYI